MTPDRVRAWVWGVGGSRFILSLGSGAMTTLLCWAGKIDGMVYATVIVATVGAYIGGNVAERRKQLDVNGPVAQPTGRPDGGAPDAN